MQLLLCDLSRRDRGRHMNIESDTLIFLNGYRGSIGAIAVGDTVLCDKQLVVCIAFNVLGIGDVLRNQLIYHG